MNEGIVVKAMTMAALATLCGALAGCGGASLPPVAAAPLLPEARGIRVVLFQKEGTPDPGGGFGEALAQVLTEAGFTVIRADQIGGAHGSDETGGPPVYDFALEYYRYFDSPQRGDWFVRPHTATYLGEDRDNTGPTWSGSSWAARHDAASGGMGWPVPQTFPPGVQACLSTWAASHPPAEQDAPVGTTYTFNDGIGVIGPPEGSEEPDTNARAARILVNVVTTCPTLAAGLKVITDSGLAAASSMDRLPTDAIVNLCRASRTSYFRKTAGTGAVRTLDDACTLALARDPRLEQMVRDVRAERAASTKEDTAYRAAKERERELARERQERLNAASPGPGVPAYGQTPAAAPGSPNAPVPGHVVSTDRGAPAHGPSGPAPARPLPPAASDCPAGQTRMCGSCRPSGTKVFQCAAM